MLQGEGLKDVVYRQTQPTLFYSTLNWSEKLQCINPKYIIWIGLHTIIYHLPNTECHKNIVPGNEARGKDLFSWLKHILFSIGYTENDMCSLRAIPDSDMVLGPIV